MYPNMIRTRPQVEPNRNYNIKEVCDILNIHRDTLRKYTNTEAIVCIRITSREVYYSGEEILHFWEWMQHRKHNL